VIVIGFDPGETTGVCVLKQKDGDAQPQQYANIKFLELMDWLDQWPHPDLVVIEDFQLLPHKAQKLAGSRFETIQAIGIIKAYAHRAKARVIIQSPTVKGIAERWTQVPAPKNHAEGHWVDGFNHAMYYLINEKLAKSALQKEMAK
jgi:hypothetical protein